jgi:multiple sugar transport system ATP-binding protein
MAVVKIKNLKVAFEQNQVIDSLDLDVADGEFIVLLGPSGCGKSTLLNCVAGLQDIAGGEIWIGENNVTWAEPKQRGIGMVFQSYALYPRMTVRENLSFGLRMAGVAKPEIEARIERAVGILQIGALLDRRPSELSGGQRQRVAIGRALVRDVDVFLFDEPLSNLDAKLRTELRVEIKKLHQKLGSTMLYVTHDQIEALTLADRIAVMNKGVIQQLDTPKVIYQRPRNRFVAAFVGTPTMNFLKGAVLDADSMLVELDSGARVSLAGYPPDAKWQVGQQVEVGVRPEQWSLGECPAQHVTVPAEVTVVEPMGADSLVWARSGQGTISARVDGDTGFEAGQSLHAHFPPSQVSVFDAGSGERI